MIRVFFCIFAREKFPQKTNCGAHYQNVFSRRQQHLEMGKGKGKGKGNRKSKPNIVRSCECNIYKHSSEIWGFRRKEQKETYCNIIGHHNDVRLRSGADIRIVTAVMTPKNIFYRPTSRIFTFVTLNGFQRRRIRVNLVAAEQRSFQRTLSRPL